MRMQRSLGTEWNPTGLFIVLSILLGRCVRTLRNDPLIRGSIQQMDQDPRDVFVNIDSTVPDHQGAGRLTVDSSRIWYGTKFDTL